MGGREIVTLCTGCALGMPGLAGRTVYFAMPLFLPHNLCGQYVEAW